MFVRLLITTLVVILVILSPLFLICYNLVTYSPEIQKIEETWWSNKDPSKEDHNIYPFKINISQKELDDLNYRLNNTRPFTKPLRNDQVYGFNTDLAQEILNYWKTEYKWRKQESFINEYPQYTTSIQGLNIHFVHYKPTNINPNIEVLPIILIHGWPSTFREYLEVLPLLASPREGYDFIFEVVVPNKPGYGFSDATEKPGMGPEEVALIFKTLMNRLGFKQFYAHGTDMGHLILRSMSTHFEDSILGFHSNTCISAHPLSWIKYILGSIYPGWIERKAHRELYYPISNFITTVLRESGYFHVQATKPDTYGAAIDDSPIGMAVQYLEKFSTGANLRNRFKQDGGLKEKYNIDTLLDNIMIFWFTKTGTSSFRFYSETFYAPKVAPMIWIPVLVPSSCLRGPQDIVSPDGMIEPIYQNLVHRGNYDVGHFTAYENPKILADDIFESIKIMEEINKTRFQKGHEVKKEL